MMEKFTEVFYWGSDTTGQFGIGDRSLGKTYPSPKCCSFSVPILKISCGEEHSAFIASNGFVYTMGSNLLGRLGINNQSQKYMSRPVLVESLMDYQIIDISCGFQHTGVVSSSGLTFTWGSGAHGALGTSESVCSWLPCKVNTAAARAISCGGRHTAVISEENSLYVWGAGEAGQLGNGSRQIQKLPTGTQLEGIVQASCGVFHTLVMLETGEIFATGGNSFGQLGIGSKESSSIFVKIPGLSEKKVLKIAAGQHSACVTQTGEVFVWGTCPFGEFLTPTRLSIANKVVDIEIGIGFGIAIDKNGNAWSWGSNSSGCLGTGDFESKSQACPVLDLQNKIVTQVACGAGFVIALGKDVENHRHEEKKRREKAEVTEESSAMNKELVNCLDEMKKEITRLQKGSGGLEELEYKLEQSKIKQGHLQSMYVEEQRQKMQMEEVIQNMLRDKECMEKVIEDLGERYEEAKGYIERLEAELRNKKSIGIEMQRMNDVVMKEKEAAEVQAKQIPGLMMKISNIEAELNNRIYEIENMKQSSVGITNHNNVLSQEIKDIPVLLSKLNGLEAQVAEYQKEKQIFLQKNAHLTQESQEIRKKYESIENELDTVKKDNKKIIQELEFIPVEKAKNQELSAINDQLERRLKQAESENFEKIENYSREISILHENLVHHSREINYLKEICADEELLSKRLRNEIKLTVDELDSERKANAELREKLSQMQGTNKEFLADLEKAMQNKIESMKGRTLPAKTIQPRSRTFKNDYDDDLVEMYGKP